MSTNGPLGWYTIDPRSGDVAVEERTGMDDKFSDYHATEVTSGWAWMGTFTD